jgi:hypothetical protein
MERVYKLDVLYTPCRLLALLIYAVAEHTLHVFVCSYRYLRCVQLCSSLLHTYSTLMSVYCKGTVYNKPVQFTMYRYSYNLRT